MARNGIDGLVLTREAIGSTRINELHVLVFQMRMSSAASTTSCGRGRATMLPMRTGGGCAVTGWPPATHTA